jgi:hypothetical protein
MPVVADVFHQRSGRRHLPQQRFVGDTRHASRERLREREELPPRLIDALGTLPKALVHLGDERVIERACNGRHGG